MSDNPASADGTTPEGNPAPAPVVDPLKPEPKVFDEAYVKSLRDEAASARVGKKEAVEAAVAAVKAEYEAKLADRDTSYTELQNELGKSWVELEKLYVSIDADIPSSKVRAFTAILQGDDRDSITESAKSTYELFDGFNTTGPAIDPTRGTGGRKDIPLNGDPILEAIKKAVGVTR